jgi:hypothetical protein
VFEKKLLRRIFGPKRDEVAEGWIKPHNYELHNLIKSRKIKWAQHVGRLGRREMHIEFCGKARWKETIRTLKTRLVA